MEITTTTTAGFLFQVLLLIFCFLSCKVVMISSTNISTDQSALLALRSRVFQFDPHGILAENWTANMPVCNWIGVTCNSPNERVTALDLSNMGLQGSIPPDGGNLSFLVSLNLRGNYFHGGLPQELGSLAELRYLNLGGNSFGGEIPAAFYNMSKLETLSLGYNLLQGNIPNEIGNLQKLKVLDMSDNQFEGLMPAAVFNISTLLPIDFFNNSLTGTLPPEMCQKLQRLEAMGFGRNELSTQKFSSISWGQCSQLVGLSLFGNKFTGEIPKEIGNLTKLFLDRNLLNGEIPREIGNLTLLRELSMGENMLRGAIPTEIGHLRNLFELLLYENFLSGSIPQSVFNISNLKIISLTINNLSWSLPTVDYSRLNLKEIYLGSNNLSGVVPHTISNLSKLTHFAIKNNQFSGPIPASLGDLNALQRLSLAANNFFSEPNSPKLSILASLVNLKKLTFLDISLNPLGGTIPSTIRNLSSLQYFYAQNCGLEGTIPVEIGNLSSLYLLDLGTNGLRGYIPTSLKELTKVQELGLDRNEIQGLVPTFVCHFKSLGVLLLNNNKLSGPLPDCWGNLTSLRYLHLYSNNFTSNLPASISKLKDLLQFDLSSNYLSGSISLEIGSLKAAILINLSNNKFSGEIPSTIGGLQQLIYFSLAGNKLQGRIPESLGNMVNLEILDLSYNSLSGVVPMSLESLQYLSYFNVSFNRLRGPVPEKGSFANFTHESFMSNEALCGGARGLQLPPCPHNSPPKAKIKRLLWLVLLIALAVLALLVVVFLLVFMRRSRKNIVPSEMEVIVVRTHARVSYYELHRATNGFCEENLLGMGSYGSVYKGIFHDGTTVAIKVFNLQHEGALKSFDTECEALCNVRHRNLVKVITCCSKPDFKALILKYMPNGSLDRWLQSRDHFLDAVQRLDIMIDVASALEYLHHGYSTPIIHCDVKPSNILLDEDMVACLSDFGFANSGGEGIVQTNTLPTIGYTAPEYGSNGLVSTSCDVYSFGILLMETFTSKKPTDDLFSGDLSIKDWIAMTVQSSTRHIMDEELLRSSDDVHVTAKVPLVTAIMELALRCSAELPEERINMKDALISLEKIKVLFLGRLH